MEFAIAVHLLERDFDIMYGACLSSSLLFAENILGPHFNLDYCSVLSN